MPSRFEEENIEHTRFEIHFLFLLYANKKVGMCVCTNILANDVSSVMNSRGFEYVTCR